MRITGSFPLTRDSMSHPNAMPRGMGVFNGALGGDMLSWRWALVAERLGRRCSCDN